jgi:flagellar basal-body rod protein FlgB
MLFGNIPLVGMLKQRMDWHQQRQSVLAENIANADTPGYRARDMREPDFGPQASAFAGPQVVLAKTDAGHLGFQARPSAAGTEKAAGYEVTPRGNGVVLEDEVMRVSQNVMDYQIASQLYSRGIGMLKTAIGKRS